MVDTNTTTGRLFPFASWNACVTLASVPCRMITGKVDIYMPSKRKKGKEGGKRKTGKWRKDKEVGYTRENNTIFAFIIYKLILFISNKVHQSSLDYMM